MLLAEAAGVAVTEMNNRGDLDAFEATIEGPRTVLKDFFVVAGHGGALDLKEMPARLVESAPLLIERRPYVQGHVALVVIGLVEGAVDHRHGSWHRHLYRLTGLCLGKVKIVNNCRLPSRDVAHQPGHGTRL